jgi:phytoene synthase
VYAGLPQVDPVLAAFQAVAMHYQIPRLYPEELIEGMSMDARGTRYESLHDLLLYCHRVAGTVGLMMCHVLGVRDARALRNAAHLGIAMQLTNICRDVLEDFRLGRVYLPARLLRGSGGTALLAGTSEAVLFAPETRRAVSLVVHTLLSEAGDYYRSGDRGLLALPFRSALAVRAARFLYAAIGTRLLLSGADPLRGRAVTPGSWKVVLVARALFASLFSAQLSLLPPSASRPQAVALREVRFPDDVLPL